MSNDNISEEYKRVSEIVSKNKKLTSIITIASIIVAIVGFFYFIQWKQKEKQQVVGKVEKQVDSVMKEKKQLQEQIAVDSAFVLMSKREVSAKQMLQIFLGSGGEVDVLEYYADTLQDYFGQKNITKDSVARRRTLRGRRIKLDIDTSKIYLRTGNDTISARVDAFYAGDPKKSNQFEVIYDIKLDTNYLVFSISSKKEGKAYEADP